jgi:hypothetical protein
MASNITMAVLVALYFSITAYGLVAFQAHRHSAAVAASINLPR